MFESVNGYFNWGTETQNTSTINAPKTELYEGQSEITEPYPTTIKSSIIDIYFDDIL